MNDDQLHIHLEENVVSHQLILLNLIKAVNNQNRYQAVSTQQDALQQSLNTAEDKITGHDWALHSLYERVTNLEKKIKQPKKGGE